MRSASLKISTSSAKNCMSLQFDLDVLDQTVVLRAGNRERLLAVGLPDLAAAGRLLRGRQARPWRPARRERGNLCAALRFDGSATDAGITAEYHGPAARGPGRRGRSSRRRRPDEAGGAARARPRRTDPRSTSTRACVDRASSASASASIARGVGAVVQIVSAATGASASSISTTALSFIAPKTSVAPRGWPREVGRQRACAGRIVRGVDEHGAAVDREALEPSGPHRLRQARAHAPSRIRREAEARSSSSSRRERHGGVARLMRAAQRQADVGTRHAASRTSRDRAPRRGDRDVEIAADQPRAFSSQTSAITVERFRGQRVRRRPESPA